MAKRKTSKQSREIARNKDGRFVISSLAEANAALAQLEELSATRDELQERLEKEFGLAELEADISDLQAAVNGFMIAKRVETIQRNGYYLRRIERHKRVWNPAKLKKLVPKSVWLQITVQKPDPDKIDDLVRAGKLKLKTIESALEEIPEKPHVRRFNSTDNPQEAEDVEAALS